MADWRHDGEKYGIELDWVRLVKLSSHGDIPAIYRFYAAMIPDPDPDAWDSDAWDQFVEDLEDSDWRRNNGE